MMKVQILVIVYLKYSKEQQVILIKLHFNNYVLKILENNKDKVFIFSTYDKIFEGIYIDQLDKYYEKFNLLCSN